MDKLKIGSKPGSAQHTRILFAEDDVGIGYLVTEMLLDEGFDVTKVENGDDGAIAFDKGQAFQLLLTDVRMRGVMDGLDLAAHVMKRNPNLPVVIVSGFTEELGERLTSVGRRATFLRKPFLMENLVSAIHNALLSTAASAVVFGLDTSKNLSPAAWSGTLA